ncbi:hypothetical protein [Streptomyces sp. NPDC023327]|uniref:hypothetical protein n=1 Tax=Streptomyces sp. NPDC023327 TaxID=3157088 RepID=UPI0033FF4C5D
MRRSPSPAPYGRPDATDAPMGLGDVLGVLVTERSWGLPALGAMLRETYFDVGGGCSSASPR